MADLLPQGDPTLFLPTANGTPPLTGRLRATPEDFVVEEVLGYAPTGSGEHAFLVVRKRDRNTHDVARALARLAGVSQVAVGYAGLKDRQAVATQAFSVHLPGRESPDWTPLLDESLEVLEATRHDRKIRRGSLRGNRFEITVKDVEGDRDVAEARLHALREQGVPNYFGSQRFGHEGGNLSQVADLFAGRRTRIKRELRGLLLSAARAHLFNLVLARRVEQRSWASAGSGDVLLLAGAGRQFAFDPEDASIPERLALMDIHPSAPLCGRRSRSLSATDAVLDLEVSVLEPWQDWVEALARNGLDEDRRALRLTVDGLQWQWADTDLKLQFALATGSYATSVLREIVLARA
ncbi:MAG: tRNA pseudouridine(13) synthase TruD [Gammaproteobacteria bacterium]|nr:tRNA pseudouridine(13) synthase TruD [Gammaproteobacteria bacterium]